MELTPRRRVALILAGVVLLALPGIGWAGGEKMDKEAMRGRVMTMSKHPFDETVSRLKQAIEG